MDWRSNQVESIFLQAIELPSEADREEFLADACASQPGLKREVEKLVSSHFRAGDFLTSPAFNPASFDGDPGPSMAGSTLGPYVLRQSLGEGGMGLVYVADQQYPIQRTVAIKIIKPGMDSRAVVARFNSERQTLALMDHENIARVLDAGSTPTGNPFFVMELIQGVPITEYCDQFQLTVHKRLELFAVVCQAVQHAHQKGIIHRDIKATNVLVSNRDGQPVPKIIDFGVAKAIHQPTPDPAVQTCCLNMIGTPLYMSPEQADLNHQNIDTRSDIYSLGVLLYELLCGTTPLDKSRVHNASYDELRRLIRDVESPCPSARLAGLPAELADSVARSRGVDRRYLLKTLGGDLDWIAVKCLEKCPSRRYDTAHELAMDIHRYLRNEPTSASPPSWVTTIAKWSRRHHLLVMAAVLLVVIFAISATVTAVLVAAAQSRTLQALRSSEHATNELRRVNTQLARETMRGNENLKQARHAVDQLLARVVADCEGMQTLSPFHRDVLEQTLQFYQQCVRQDQHDPLLRDETSAVYQKVGEIQNALGHPDKAEFAYGQAALLLDELARQYPNDQSYPVRIADLAGVRAFNFAFTENQDESIRYRAEQLAICRRLAESCPDDSSYRVKVAHAETDLGNALYIAGYYSRAEPHFRQGLRVIEELHQSDPENRQTEYGLAFSQAWLGNYLMQTRSYKEAESLLRSAIAMADVDHRKSPADPSPLFTLAQWTHKLAIVLHHQRQYDESLRLHQDAIAKMEVVAHARPHVENYRRVYSGAHSAFARTLWSVGRVSDAEASFRLSISEREAINGPSSNKMTYQVYLGSVHATLGQLLLAQGRIVEAEAECSLARQLLESAATTTPEAVIANDELAWFLATCPLPQFRDPLRSVEHVKKAIGNESKYFETWRTLAIACYYLKDWKASEEAFTKSFNLLPANRDPEDYFYRSLVASHMGANQSARHWYELGVENASSTSLLAYPWVEQLKSQAFMMLAPRPTDGETLQGEKVTDD